MINLLKRITLVLLAGSLLVGGTFGKGTTTMTHNDGQPKSAGKIIIAPGPR
jgi:hypothetical protein